MLNVDIITNQLNYGLGNNGKIKPLNGVNGIPLSIAPGYPELQKQFNEMEITDIRLHDTYGPLDIDNYYSEQTSASQLMVNVPEGEREKAGKLLADLANLRTIFPNARAGMIQGSLELAVKDANWEIADSYLLKIINNEEYNPKNVQRNVIFRIGRSFDGGFMIPENIDIYAKLVEKIVNRYSINYAVVGLKRKITHWEIWNEPNLSFFWNETAQKYFDFYSVIAKSIKNVDPDAKVGGTAALLTSTLGDAYTEGLLQHCRDNSLPLDFISWHLYNMDDPERFNLFSTLVRNLLIKYGFGKIESILSEWSTSGNATINNFTKQQSAMSASYIATVLIKLQSSSIDRAHYYRADGASFGLFNLAANPKKPNERAYCTYSAQVFKLFAKMLETPYIVRCSDVSATGISLLCAKNDKKINILVANHKITSDLNDITTKPEQGYYKQYHVDSNRAALELNDEISKETWFGGKDPATLYSNNKSYEKFQEKEFIVHSSASYKYYSDSADGLTLNIFGLNAEVKSIRAYRIYEGGDLSDLMPEAIDTAGIVSHDGDSLVIKDNQAVEYTVTLYSIDLE